MSKLNYIILHGYGGSPGVNFFPWLKNELVRTGADVSVPYLPNPDTREINAKIDYVLKNFRFDSNTILVGHSLGGSVALGVLERLEKPIKKLVLVAGYFVKEDFDYNKIKKNVGEIVYLEAKNDNAIPKNSASIAKKNLDAKVISVVAQDEHFCGEEEPEVLKVCLSD